MRTLLLPTRYWKRWEKLRSLDFDFLFRPDAWAISVRRRKRNVFRIFFSSYCLLNEIQRRESLSFFCTERTTGYIYLELINESNNIIENVCPCNCYQRVLIKIQKPCIYVFLNRSWIFPCVYILNAFFSYLYHVVYFCKFMDIYRCIFIWSKSVRFIKIQFYGEPWINIRITLWNLRKPGDTTFRLKTVGRRVSPLPTFFFLIESLTPWQPYVA